MPKATDLKHAHVLLFLQCALHLHVTAGYCDWQEPYSELGRPPGRALRQQRFLAIHCHQVRPLWLSFVVVAHYTQ